MLDILRLPFLFQPFDPLAEHVSLKILARLSRYENLNDLSEGTISSVLMNDALRQKLSTCTDEEEQSQLVKEALVEENQRVHTELKKKEREIEEKERTLRSLEHDLVESQEAGRRKESEWEKELSQEREEREVLQNRVNELANILNEREQGRSRGEMISAYITRYLFLPGLVALGVVALVAVGIKHYRTMYFWHGTGGTFAILTFGWALLADWAGQRNIAVKGSGAFRRFRRYRRYVFGAFGSLILAILGSYLYDMLKDAF